MTQFGSIGNRSSSCILNCLLDRYAPSSMMWRHARDRFRRYRGLEVQRSCWTLSTKHSATSSAQPDYRWPKTIKQVTIGKTVFKRVFSTCIALFVTSYVSRPRHTIVLPSQSCPAQSINMISVANLDVKTLSHHLPKPRVNELSI